MNLSLEVGWCLRRRALYAVDEAEDVGVELGVTGSKQLTGNEMGGSVATDSL